MEPIPRALGVLMSHLHLSLDEAEQVLKETAVRAGISDGELARVVLETLVEKDS
jgi:hypothetical protein